ncbi:hypothetical protein Q75_06840 [Bacillus coahuilensis p1.1.43]|uniref:glycine oxidase n=1 Tax=Bacillus coahuilensis p1.1.43 TaxID=1150625 RepID=A0A147K985_9BACI|nr:glycine oxidase ThiO [Bacillus coahuilensis]KUP06920.1 hypothetical protein Q75_06840 [Bacillus coahuilensis p1.1.43]
MQRFDSIIVGGGVIGASIAFELSTRGQTVLILENKRIGSGASNAAAGMLGAHNEFSSDHPIVSLALESQKLFPAWSRELKNLTGIDIELVNDGLIKVWEDGATPAIQKQWQYWSTTTSSSAVAYLNKEKLIQQEPAIGERIEGGLYFQKDGHVNPQLLTKSLIQAAKLNGAVVLESQKVQQILIEKNKVRGVSTDSTKFISEHVVMATGAWSNQLARDIGLELNIIPVKGECLKLKTDRPLLRSTIFSENGCYIVPKKRNILYIGATSTPHTFDERLSINGCMNLLSRATTIIPEIKQASLVDFWAGIRPKTEDAIPYLGEHPNLENVWVATGHYRNGILLSAITGKIIADCIQGRKNWNLDAFRLGRPSVLNVRRKTYVETGD